MKLNKKNIILSMASLSLVAAVFFFNPQKAQAKDVTFRVTDYGATGNGQTDLKRYWSGCAASHLCYIFRLGTLILMYHHLKDMRLHQEAD